MSRTYKDAPQHKQSREPGRGRRRHISVRSVRRDPPDLHKLSRAVMALALAQADAEARAAVCGPASGADEPAPSAEESAGD